MLGVSGLLGNRGDGAPAVEAHEGGGGDGGGGGGGGGEVGGVGSSSGGFSEEEKGRGEEGDRSSGGNRWPRQETLALLKIRSDMDVAFRDSSLKGPLWEDVSRKLAELGYHRSAKKCKEKFENVYKYHKRTREGRATKPEGKNYRFFDQLEALESHPSLLSLPPPKPQTPVATVKSVAMPGSNPPIVMSHVSTVPSTTNPINVSQNNATDPTNASPHPLTLLLPTTNPTTIPSQLTGIRSFLPHMSTNLMLNSTSSSTSSDQEPERHRRRKRKWEDFFERIMKEVMDKQEEMQKKFLEALERREHDRMLREEAWRVQEMARLNREHELLVQERSITAAKDAAVITFLQKISEQQNTNVSQIQVQMQETTTPLPLPLQPQALPQPPPPPQHQHQHQHQPPLQLTKILDNPKTNNGGENFIPASSSRWPKAEVEALIKLRTNLDLKYQDNGPKGPLWEEISAAMRKLGYNRSSKRCKEKWENINKYFKKVKESNKKRPEDSKTCPYFHQLDALYRDKNKGTIDSSFHQVAGSVMKPENLVVAAAPIMARPEQQWPLPQEQHGPEGAMADHESENVDDDEINHEDDDVDDEDEDDDDEGGGYEIVTNKPSSLTTVE